MFQYIFLLGRPGSGKSLIYRILSEEIKDRNLADEVMRIDDFPIIDEILEEDEVQEKYVNKEGGWEITDLSLLDDVLKRMDKKLKELREPNRIIFVEFSRDSYRKAMKNFDPEILDNSLIIYIYCPFHICLKRNVRRFEEDAEVVDNHIVPKDIMKSYYEKDDYEELLLDSEEKLREVTPTEVLIVKNDSEGLDKVGKELEKVIQTLETNN